MIDEKDFAVLDMRYKKIEDCDRDMTISVSQQHDLDKRLAVIEHTLKGIVAMISAIGGGIVALVIKVYLGG